MSILNAFDGKRGAAYRKIYLDKSWGVGTTSADLTAINSRVEDLYKLVESLIETINKLRDENATLKQKYDGLQRRVRAIEKRG